jgi:hypothetical protein
MPQLTARSLIRGITRSHSAQKGPAMVTPRRSFLSFFSFLSFLSAWASGPASSCAGGGSAGAGTLARSWSRGVRTAVRVQPGEAQGISLRSRLARVASQSAHSPRGGGRRVANASSWAISGQLQVP